MEFKDEWEKLLEKYSIIKNVYIKCEETDPQLKTNLQPLNEFRAALDHIMKLMGIYYFGDISSQEKEMAIKSQFEKLDSHFNRSFYDVCDMLSINYRNKIIDILSVYDTETIKTAIPEYYSKTKPRIEEISSHIVTYREQKGGHLVDDYERFSEYQSDVLELESYYIAINKAIASMDEIQCKETKKLKKDNLKNWIFGGLIGATLSSIIAVILHFCGI